MYQTWLTWLDGKLDKLDFLHAAKLPLHLSHVESRRDVFDCNLRQLCFFFAGINGRRDDISIHHHDDQYYSWHQEGMMIYHNIINVKAPSHRLVSRFLWLCWPLVFFASTRAEAERRTISLSHHWWGCSVRHPKKVRPSQMARWYSSRDQDFAIRQIWFGSGYWAIFVYFQRESSRSALYSNISNPIATLKNL